MWNFLMRTDIQQILAQFNIDYSLLLSYPSISATTESVISQIYEYESQQKDKQEKALSKEEKFSYVRAWPVERETGELLFLLTCYFKPQLILECGTSFGLSTLFFADALEQNDRGKIITIEVSKLKHDHAWANFVQAQHTSRIIQEKKAFDQFLKFSVEKFDFVFLDCDRSRYHVYLEALLPRLSSRATIIADNALDRADDMKKYFHVMTTDKRFHTALLPLGDGVLLSQLVN